MSRKEDSQVYKNFTNPKIQYQNKLSLELKPGIVPEFGEKSIEKLKDEQEMSTLGELYGQFFLMDRNEKNFSAWLKSFDANDPDLTAKAFAARFKQYGFLSMKPTRTPEEDGYVRKDGGSAMRNAWDDASRPLPCAPLQPNVVPEIGIETVKHLKSGKAMVTSFDHLFGYWFLCHENEHEYRQWLIEQHVDTPSATKVAAVIHKKLRLLEW